MLRVLYCERGARGVGRAGIFYSGVLDIVGGPTVRQNISSFRNNFALPNADRPESRRYREYRPTDRPAEYQWFPRPGQFGFSHMWSTVRT